MKWHGWSGVKKGDLLNTANITCKGCLSAKGVIYFLHRCVVFGRTVNTFYHLVLTIAFILQEPIYPNTSGSSIKDQ